MPERRIKSVSVDPKQVRLWKAPLRGDGPETIYVDVPVSSLAVDRDGDQFSEQGLQALLAAVKTGRVPLYANHGRGPSGMTEYRFEDIFGVWNDGRIEDGVLRAIAALDPYDYRSQVLEGKIQAGLPLGWSVGFIPTVASPRKEGGYTFDDVDLLEISVVGIPSNPDAVSAAIAAVAKSFLTEPQMSEKDLKEEKKADDEEEEKPSEDEKPEDDEEKEQKPCPDDEEEKGVQVLDETQIRQIVADEVGQQLAKALAPVLERLKILDALPAIQATLSKPLEKRAPGPRGIVVVREPNADQKKAATPEAPGPVFVPAA
ncbi:MAG: HK97 family phage prohead protease [Methanomicrobiales archaeon]|nr:HK97 family phage prohead protease [Methanomicrobiales archaeon]